MSAALDFPPNHGKGALSRFLRVMPTPTAGRSSFIPGAVERSTLLPRCELGEVPLGDRREIPPVPETDRQAGEVPKHVAKLQHEGIPRLIVDHAAVVAEDLLHLVCELTGFADETEGFVEHPVGRSDRRLVDGRFFRGFSVSIEIHQALLSVRARRTLATGSTLIVLAFLAPVVDSPTDR